MTHLPVGDLSTMLQGKLIDNLTLLELIQKSKI
jgi:hypothetical protein